MCEKIKTHKLIFKDIFIFLGFDNTNLQWNNVQIKVDYHSQRVKSALTHFGSNLTPVSSVTCCRANDGCVLVYGFQKLSDDQWDTLYPLHLLLGMEELLLQVFLFIFDVLLLDLQELQLLLKFLQAQKEKLEMHTTDDQCSDLCCW